MTAIDSFTGDYEFLSNFYHAPRVDPYTGIIGNTAEHLFQASKTKVWDERVNILRANGPGVAKKLGRSCTLRPSWELIKLDCMNLVLVDKFRPGSEEAERLMETRGVELIEGNWWGDTYWGVCEGEGQNWLGRLLMSRRAQLWNAKLKGHDLA